MIRLFLVAPAAAMRAGLRALLEGTGVEIVGDAPALAGGVPPPVEVDLLLVTEDTDLAALAAHRPVATPPALLLLADSAERLPVIRQLPLRSWGIVPLDSSGPALRAAIAAVTEGFILLPDALAEELLPPPPQESVRPAEPLTARELEILPLLGQGLTNRDIARRLQISEHTVKFHLTSIFGKLGAASRTEAVTLAARQGLITL